MEDCNGCSVGFIDSIRLSEMDVINFLIRHGVLKDETLCCYCQGLCKLNKNNLLFRCNRTVVKHRRKRRCTFKVSSREGTIIEKSHLNLTTLFVMVSTILHLMPPHLEFLVNELGLSEKTTIHWNGICRDVFLFHLERKRERLGGPMTIVELGEKKFGSESTKAEGQLLFGGVERNSTRSFFVTAEDKTAAILFEIIKEWILPGTTIVSYCWREYNCVAHKGFQDLIINHSITFVHPDTYVHMNNLERAWKECRAIVPTYGSRKENYVRYLSEFLFKRRYPEHGSRLHYFFKAAADMYTPKH